jgi:hypothetical protein
MDDDKGMLNLDEMLGEKKLKVIYQGKEYSIRSVKSLSPQDFGRVMAYGTKFSSLTETDIQANDGATVMKAIDDVLEIVAPSLPRYKPTLKERFGRGYKRKFSVSLHEATAILQFWTENNRQKNAVGAVMPVVAKKKRMRR